MTEEMKSFLEKLAKDEALRKRMEACKSPEEAFDVAKGVAEELRFEDFTTTMTKLNEVITKRNNGELTDEDLEQVAGGMSSAQTTYLVMAIFNTVVVAAASAAM